MRACLTGSLRVPRQQTLRIMHAGATPEAAPPLTEVREGRAHVQGIANNAVFYNPVMEMNRDLSVLTIQTFQEKFAAENAAAITAKRERAEKARAAMIAKNPDGPEPPVLDPPRPHPSSVAGLRVLDALSATGLRAFRYSQEIEGIGTVHANDLDPAAVEAIENNKKLNPDGADKVIPSLGDATMFMYQHRGPSDAERFDVVDLDPYGSPAMFLDAAVQCVTDGGLLCVTATDLAVLCGTYSEVCWSQYGAMSLRGSFSYHEFAIRAVLASIESAANRYKRHIVPVISFQADFYCRVFVRVHTSAAQVKKSPSKLAYVWQCHGCESFSLQRVGKVYTKGTSTKYSPGTGPVVPQACEHCGRNHNMGGPIWAEPTFDPDWVTATQQKMKQRQSVGSSLPSLGSADRLGGMLTLIGSELPDVPLYYDLSMMCNTLHCQAPPMAKIRSGLMNAGYRVSQAHTKPLAIKTDAPATVMWDVLRCYVKETPKLKPPKANSPAATILAKEPQLEAVWTQQPGSQSGKRVTGKATFVAPPQSHWGPKARAGGKKRKKSDSDGEGGDNA